MCNIQKEIQMNKRSVVLDIMKGISIILVVLGHCGFPFKSWIYLFHMGVFFLLSGFIWKDRYSENLSSYKKFCIKKMKRLYVPYVLVNTLFVILNNIFIQIGMYTNNSNFVVIGGTSASGGCMDYLSCKEMLRAIINIWVYFGAYTGTQLGGTTWFLRALFFASLLFCTIKIIKNKSLRRVVQGIMLLFCFVSMIYFNRLSNVSRVGGVSRVVSQICSAYPLYLIGGLLQQYDEYFEKNRYKIGLLSFLILCLLNKFGEIDMVSGQIENPFFFLFAALSGWHVLRAVSQYISTHNSVITEALVYLGKHSMCIMLWHFLSFKIVTFIVLLIKKENMILLASFPVLDIGNRYLWIVYAIVGVIIPLIGLKIAFLIQRVIKNHFVNYKWQ